MLLPHAPDLTLAAYSTLAYFVHVPASHLLNTNVIVANLYGLIYRALDGCPINIDWVCESFSSVLRNLATPQDVCFPCKLLAAGPANPVLIWEISTGLAGPAHASSAGKAQL